MDTLTLAGIIFSLIAIGLAFFSMWYSKNMIKKRLHRIARATMALQANEDEQALCNAIKEIAPHACPLLDYTIETKEGKPAITKWSAKGKKPDQKILHETLEKLREEMKSAL